MREKSEKEWKETRDINRRRESNWLKKEKIRLWIKEEKGKTDLHWRGMMRRRDWNQRKSKSMGNKMKEGIVKRDRKWERNGIRKIPRKRNVNLLSLRFELTYALYPWEEHEENKKNLQERGEEKRGRRNPILLSICFVLLTLGGSMNWAKKDRFSKTHWIFWSTIPPLESLAH